MWPVVLSTFVYLRFLGSKNYLWILRFLHHNSCFQLTLHKMMDGSRNRAMESPKTQLVWINWKYLNLTFSSFLRLSFRAVKRKLCTDICTRSTLLLSTCAATSLCPATPSDFYSFGTFAHLPQSLPWTWDRTLQTSAALIRQGPALQLPVMTGTSRWSKLRMAMWEY